MYINFAKCSNKTRNDCHSEEEINNFFTDFKIILFKLNKETDFTKYNSDPVSVICEVLETIYPSTLTPLMYVPVPVYFL